MGGREKEKGKSSPFKYSTMNELPHFSPRSGSRSPAEESSGQWRECGRRREMREEGGFLPHSTIPPCQGLVPGRAAAPSQVGIREQTPLGGHTSLSFPSGTCTCDSTSLTLTVKGASLP